MLKWKTRRRTASPAQPMQLRLRRELALSAGMGPFQTRDPVAQVAEYFKLTFDRQGMRHAAALEAQLQNGSGFSAQEGEQEQASREGAQSAEKYSDSGEARTRPGTDVVLHRFSQMAFRRGNLSAAVVDGSGKMMLVSCLKQAAGAQGSRQERTRTLFGLGAQQRNVSGHDPDQMLFHRGVVGSAVGLVVDALRDAGRVAQSLADMSAGVGELREGEGALTLRRMYPFLDTSQEENLLEQCGEALKTASDPGQRAALQNALVHARAMIDKKAQTRTEFVNKLRFVSDRAREMLEEFEAPGFVDEVVAAVLADAPLPEAQGGEGYGTDNPVPPAEPEDGEGALPGGSETGAAGESLQ